MIHEIIIVGLIAKALVYGFLKFTQYCESKKNNKVI
jgi:hypothetical protein